MLPIFKKETFWGKSVYSNIIFTQNLSFIYADTSASSAEFLMSGLTRNLSVCAFQIRLINSRAVLSFFNVKSLYSPKYPIYPVDLMLNSYFPGINDRMKNNTC